MGINKLQDQWDELGKLDPLTSILFRTDKIESGWNVQEFFDTGAREITNALKYIGESGIAIPRGKALDFGCGVGRLTQALADHFQEVTGIDIAPSMIALADRYNRHGEKCRYILNETDSLGLFPDNAFDLIYSVITLQHMPPRYAKNYVREFLRVLAPGGALLFQIPSGPNVINENGTVNLQGLVLRIVPKFILDATYRKVKYGGRPRPDAYWIGKQTMVDFLNGIGARIVAVRQTREKVYIDCSYLVTKD